MDESEAWGILTSFTEADLEALRTLIFHYGGAFPGIVTGVLQQRRYDRQRYEKVLAEDDDNPSERP